MDEDSNQRLRGWPQKRTMCCLFDKSIVVHHHMCSSKWNSQLSRIYFNTTIGISIAFSRITFIQPHQNEDLVFQSHLIFKYEIGLSIQRSSWTLKPPKSVYWFPTNEVVFFVLTLTFLVRTTNVRLLQKHQNRKWFYHHNVFILANARPLLWFGMFLLFSKGEIEEWSG